MNPLIATILSNDDGIRNQSLDRLCNDATVDELLSHCCQLDAFRLNSDNLYHRVRALFFLAAIYRYHIPQQISSNSTGLIPFRGYQHLLKRRFGEAHTC